MVGARWFHTGGIYAGLAAGTADVVIAAAEAARRHATVDSYDLNTDRAFGSRSADQSRLLR
jgi:2-dehydro-3-deoxygluconokinase